jgi:hypothetical protein
MTAEIPDPQSFIDMYGPDAQVVLGEGEGKPMSLSTALQFEEMCTIDSEVRMDPVRRTRFLARSLAAGGSLLPEHEYLLGEGE